MIQSDKITPKSIYFPENLFIFFEESASQPENYSVNTIHCVHIFFEVECAEALLNYISGQKKFLIQRFKI